MKICGTGIMPGHIAKAYGVKPGLAATRQVSPAPPTRRVQQSDAYQPSDSVKNLVAGRVSQPVNFDSPAIQTARPAAANGAFQLYTRAADKMEAAIAVQIGRSIDVQG